MNETEFITALQHEGFGEIVTVERDPNGFLGTHTHPFEARALILAGEIRLNIDGVEQVFRAGDVFHLATNQAHSESYGPEGVRYLAGRK